MNSQARDYPACYDIGDEWNADARCTESQIHPPDWRSISLITMRTAMSSSRVVFSHLLHAESNALTKLLVRQVALKIVVFCDWILVKVRLGGWTSASHSFQKRKKLASNSAHLKVTFPCFFSAAQLRSLRRGFLPEKRPSNEFFSIR